MIAFHNDIKIKDLYLNRVKEHRIADEITKGIYWENGRGCAVGCTIHGSDHSKYETELGIPIILARLEDGIFEGLPLSRAKIWPEEFLNSINVGSDLSDVWPKFAIWLLTDKDHGVLQYAKNDTQKKSIQTIADYYSRYKEITKKQWIAAAYSVSAAADADSYAAYAAASAAAAADAAAADAKENHRIAQADKLLELLRECK
jgi:hypothetical protein